MTSIFNVIGLMSGTSLDGVDVALIQTNGQDFIKTGPFLTLPYPENARATIRSVFGRQDNYGEAEKTVTDFHIQAVWAFLARHPCNPDLIGFHGQTIYHAPQDGITVQIGDGQRLADETGIDVVCDFRSADVQAGGQGAPLAPLYHQSLAKDLPKPLAVLNIGGVANVTYLGRDNDILAFDTGPGNALMDDAMLRLTGKPHDENGALAATGTAHEGFIKECLIHSFFETPPPKSLDRDQFQSLLTAINHLPAADQMATLTDLTAATIMNALNHMPEIPARWLVTGGGRHNSHLMQRLKQSLGAPIDPVESAGWNGDALEAEAFAYLAMRSKLGLSLSLPTTTGVSMPATGGRFYAAKAAAT